MNFRVIGLCGILIIVLLILGPENTAAFLKGIGKWATDFINAL